MRSTRAERRGHVHEHGHYSSLDGFLDLVAPFVEAGVAAGERTVVVADRAQRVEVERHLGSVPGFDLLPVEGVYARPASTVKAFRRMVTDRMGGGARVRVAAPVSPEPAPGPGAASWESWVRYEAALNHVLADLPLHGLCLYDTSTTPPEVLDELDATYPYRLSPDGASKPNPRFEDPASFLHARRRLPPPPLQLGGPDLVVDDPSPRSARLAVAATAERAGLARETLEDLLVGVSEAVANAVMHGVPPVVLRTWVTPGRVVATVTDAGTGPSDAFAGYVAAPRVGAGGLGLWITHQVCADVTLSQGPDGFTIRLVAGALGAS